MAAKVIDIHVHLAGTGDSMAGCRMSNEFILSPVFASMMEVLETTPLEIKDDLIRESVLRAIDTSEHIDYAVFLALDGVYKNGRYIKSESHFVIPNDYIINIARSNRRVLFGASVHPYREKKDMLNETMKCIDSGAVLFKWILSSQQIDPEDDRCIPFYKVLAKEGVPLLCRLGEYAVPASGFEYSGPKTLERALDIGVKVIVAPGTGAHYNTGQPSVEGHFDGLLEMLMVAEKNGWGLYADISALCPPASAACLERINREIGDGRISPKRFLYGSDFPMSLAGVNAFKNSPKQKQVHGHITEYGNPLDNNCKTFRESGVHASIFTNACEVLRF